MSPEGLNTATLAESTPSTHAGSVVDPEQAGAGCVGLTGDESQADAPSAAAGDRAGCAAPAPMEASEARATPPQSLREFERALRGLGFTRLQAEHIARRGFEGATASAAPPPEPEPDTDMHTLMAALQRRAAALKGT